MNRHTTSNETTERDTAVMRKQFEEWAIGPDGPWTPRAIAQRVGDSYGPPELAIQWGCWQAARASLPPPSAEPTDEERHDEAVLAWLGPTPAAASPPIQVAPSDIEQRTEKIRLSHANADSKGKIQLRHEVECLLAHIALLRSAAPVPQVAPEKVSARQLDELLGDYWEIAYSEGNTGISRGSEAQVVLSAIRALISKEAAPASPSAEQLWQEAISQAAFYVLNHCADGEHHSEAIMSMPLPKVAGSKASADSAAVAGVRAALVEYYDALTARKHGGIAQGVALVRIERAMGMTWEDHKAAMQPTTGKEPT